MIDNILYNIHGRLRRLHFPLTMGIINLSPDSFFSTSAVLNAADAVKRAEKHILEGAAILDLGAISTRPGAQIISPEEEMDRLLPAFREIRAMSKETLISIDTVHSITAHKLLDLGADIINDVSAGTYAENMPAIIAQYNVPMIAMHMRGTPATMHKEDYAPYTNITAEVLQFFSAKINDLNAHGITQIIVDPGFGFSKKMNDNYTLLRQLEFFRILDRPLLIGISRKSMIYKLLETDPEQALNGTLAAQTIALIKGADILRVHDVGPAMEVIKVVSRTDHSDKF